VEKANVVIKIFSLAYHQAISWLPPCISHLFHNGLLWGDTLFLQLGCFGLDNKFPEK